MILRLIGIFLLLCPLNGWSATITAENTGGNYSVGSTWIGGVVPDPGTDTVIIPATLAAAVVLDDSRTIPETTIEDDVHGLVQGTGVITTLGGALKVGNGASKDGAFTFGAGSTLAMGANNVVLNNCKLRSNSTSASWATIIGSGAWQKGSAYTAPKEDIVLKYITFNTSGTLSFPVGAVSNGSAALINQLDLQHNAFVSTGAIVFAVDGWTPLDTKLVINNNDFDTTGVLTIYGIGGTPTNTVSFNGNTGRGVANKSILFRGSNKWEIKSNVLFGYHLGGTSTIGNVTFSGNYIEPLNTLSAGAAVFYSNEFFPANTIQSNYAYLTYANPHPFTASGTGGSGVHQFTGNVIETVFNTDTSNIVIVDKLGWNVDKNILIGSGYLVNNVGDTTGNGVVVSNNTVYKSTGLWLSETGNYTGTINIKSNLQINGGAGLSDITSTPQSITISDYNDWYNVATPYSNVSVLSGIVNDVSENPFFVDENRNLAKWGQVVHSTDGTVIAARAKLLAINGYNATTKAQSDTPSGAVIYGTDAALVNWVQAGFAPTNSALKTAGESGSYIGAMDVVSLGNPAALMMIQ